MGKEPPSVELLQVTFASSSETFPVLPQSRILTSLFRYAMNDLQAKFALTLVGAGLLFAYGFPTLKQASQDRDSVVSQVGQVYIGPTANDPKAPRGNVSIEELHRYEAQKAAERKAALGLQ